MFYANPQTLTATVRAAPARLARCDQPRRLPQPPVLVAHPLDPTSGRFVVMQACRLVKPQRSAGASPSSAWPSRVSSAATATRSCRVSEKADLRDPCRTHGMPLAWEGALGMRHVMAVADGRAAARRAFEPTRAPPRQRTEPEDSDRRTAGTEKKEPNVVGHGRAGDPGDPATPLTIPNRGHWKKRICNET